MPVHWTREMVQTFISLFKQKECLYNLNSKDYVNRALKARAFNNILRQMRVLNKDIELEDIRKKIKTIRTQYVRENRLIEESQRSGNDTDGTYIPKLWCYNQLSFLREHCLKKPGTFKYLNSSADDESSLFSFEDTANTFEIPRRRTKIFRRVHSVKENNNRLISFVEPVDTPAKISKTTQVNNSDQGVKSCQEEVTRTKRLIWGTTNSTKKYDWLGKLVTTQMEDIAEGDQNDAAWEVQCVMRKFVEKSQNKY